MTLLDKKEIKDGVQALIARTNFVHSTEPWAVRTVIFWLSSYDYIALCSKIFIPFFSAISFKPLTNKAGCRLPPMGEK